MRWRYTKMTLMLAVVAGIVAWLSEGGAQNGFMRAFWFAILACPVAIVADVVTKRLEQRQSR